MLDKKHYLMHWTHAPGLSSTAWRPENPPKLTASGCTIGGPLREHNSLSCKGQTRKQVS